MRRGVRAGEEGGGGGEGVSSGEVGASIEIRPGKLKKII